MPFNYVFFMEAYLPSNVPYDVFVFIRAFELMIGI